MMQDPCFHCPLPDCDDTSPQCEVRRLMNSLMNKRRNGWQDEITEEERSAYSTFQSMWKLEKAAKRSEGQNGIKSSAP